MKLEVILLIVIFSILIGGFVAFWLYLITRNKRVENYKNHNKPIRIELIDILAFLTHESGINEGRRIVVRGIEDNKIYIIEETFKTHSRLVSRMDYKEVMLDNITFNGNPKMWLAMKDGVQTKEALKNKIDFHEQGNMWIRKYHKNKINLNSIVQLDGPGKYPYATTNQTFSFYKFNKEIDISELKDATIVSAIVEFDIEEKYKNKVK